jgi:hypothetical protein
LRVFVEGKDYLCVVVEGGGRKKYKKIQTILNKMPEKIINHMIIILF